ncbi:DeoR/GlpR family DNA-binding transcription regulator [Oerskovia paurometabola]|uniref:DeoR/GlpR family DNA-binding transcription regulator n=1 Tax=Oerskovia paurometabola TaxID=162170 RepID=A0ABW1XDL6_9CELL|nr:DeoR/GlpR family DNA-binding transcription regulator [Oerskovia paurometabola]MBM7496611.1 DeoR/GlpR family transcriptional regulator of sugar metabolism [Oerskovia paurometabola]
MLASQRHERILAGLRDHGAVRIADLTQELGVSDMTVRRDLLELAEQGLLRKVHGGAVSPQATSHEPGFEAKSTLALDEKRAIARAAARLVSPGSSIALSAGTTTHLLAVEIAADPRLRPLTVVTNSLPVAEALHRAGDPRLETVLTGGSRTPSDALVGPLTEAALASLRVDQTFLGAHGVSVEAGLTTPNLDEAATNRALVAIAGQTVVLADHSKWTTTGLSVFARLDQVDVLVTDEALPAGDQAAVRDVVEHLVVVTRDGPTPPALPGPYPPTPAPQDGRTSR